MAWQTSTGDYVAQILAYEEDPLRLLKDIQLHVAASNALYAAVFLCRYSEQPSAIEKRGIIAASSRLHHNDHDHSIDKTRSSAATRQNALRGDLTLTLLQVDTTWRFDSFSNRRASPMLSWPTIRTFFNLDACEEGDLILKNQIHHSDANFIPHPAAHLLHLEIGCKKPNDAAVNEIARKLRTDLRFWSRQLLYQSDPAQSQREQDGERYFLMLEFDTRHTAETLATSLDSEWLRQLSGEDISTTHVRVFSLVGSATYENVTPLEPSELPIDNRTHKETLTETPTEPSYFGLRPESYVHI